MTEISDTRDASVVDEAVPLVSMCNVYWGHLDCLVEASIDNRELVQIYNA